MKRSILTRKSIVGLFAVLCLGLLTVAAEAALINYQFTGSGVHGTYNGETATFEDAQFLINITGDTLNVINDSLGWLIYQNLTGTMSLYGDDLGANQFFNAPITDSPLYVYYDSSSQLIGFGTGDPTLDPSDPAAGVDQLVLWIPSLIDYDLKTYTELYGAAQIFNYLGLGVDALPITDVAFDTVTSASFQAVPVPAPVLLLASGLIGLVVVRRKGEK